MAKIIIFGINDLAALAHFYLTIDSEHEVVAFTVHEKYRTSNSYKNLPLLSFETIQESHSVNDFMLFAPMIGTKMNQVRENIYNEGKNKGYQFISYISSKATLFDNQIGDNCFILEDNTIQPFTSIGNNVVLWSGNHIGHHSKIEDHCFFTSHVVMSGHCIIGRNSFLGVNSTLRDGTTLAKGTLIAMGACFTRKSSEEWSVYVGNPAKKNRR
jgi:sugar O-acyltransferase (sialic acid O-acetyltransferase NeuD family)